MIVSFIATTQAMSTKPGNSSGSRSNDDSPPGGDDRDQARAQDLNFEKM